MDIADGRHDFDFWTGTWRIHNRRLRARLAGSTEWDEFEARGQTWPILNGPRQPRRVPHGLLARLPGHDVPLLRPGDPAVVDPLGRQPARAPGAAGRRLLRRRRRHLLRRRLLRGPPGPRALHLDARRLAALGAGVLRGRREDLGDELDDGHGARGPSGARALRRRRAAPVRDRARRSRPLRALVRRVLPRGLPGAGRDRVRAVRRARPRGPLHLAARHAGLRRARRDQGRFLRRSDLEGAGAPRQRADRGLGRRAPPAAAAPGARRRRAAAGRRADGDGRPARHRGRAGVRCRGRTRRTRSQRARKRRSRAIARRARARRACWSHWTSRTTSRAIRSARTGRSWSGSASCRTRERW